MRFLALVIISVSVAGSEIALHWYAGKGDSPVAHAMRAAYLYMSGATGQQPMVSTTVDLLVPAIILGLLAGWLGRQWNGVVLMLCVIALAAGVVLLLPLYGALIPKGTRSPLWPDNARFALMSIPEYYAGVSVETLFLCGFFACIMYVGGKRSRSGAAVVVVQQEASRSVREMHIKLPPFDRAVPESIMAWETAAGEFAENGAGEVRLVANENPRSDHVWEEMVLSALKANVRVTRVIMVDPSTRDETVVFEREQPRERSTDD